MALNAAAMALNAAACQQNPWAFLDDRIHGIKGGHWTCGVVCSAIPFNVGEQVCHHHSAVNARTNVYLSHHLFRQHVVSNDTFVAVLFVLVEGCGGDEDCLGCGCGCFG
jgi:hypothetical protein